MKDAGWNLFVIYAHIIGCRLSKFKQLYESFGCMGICLYIIMYMYGDYLWMYAVLFVRWDADLDTFE